MFDSCGMKVKIQGVLVKLVKLFEYLLILYLFNDEFSRIFI